MLDELQEEQEKDEEPRLISCISCRKKHFLGKCPLSSLKVCIICEETLATKHFPSLLRLLKVLRKSGKESNQLPGITQNPSPFNTWTNSYYLEQVPQQIYNPTIPWKTFDPPPTEYLTSWPLWPCPWTSSSNQISPWPQEWFGAPSLGQYLMQTQQQ